MLQPTTLRGVFPERRPPPKRNFIKENMRRLKQGQEPRLGGSDSKVSTENRLNNEVKLTAHLSKTNTSTRQPEGDTNANVKGKRQLGIQRLEIKPSNKKSNNKKEENQSQTFEMDDIKLVNRAMQTEQGDNMEAIYSTGTIRLPSAACVTNILKNRKMFPRRNNSLCQGDSPQADFFKNEKIDYIKRNMNVNKHKLPDRDAKPNPNTLPPSYKRGSVPKYIKQKKELVVEDVGDVDCPAGHVLLPDEERKETLRVLRESYAEKIQELNCMPVRSDTLKMQKRKIELEEELKKIDEGIKVFQRPKVFVKINV